MKTIINRLRRLEHVVAPDERAQASAEAIQEARRRRLGADYDFTNFPPESYAGCRTASEHIQRTRELLRARQETLGG
jgi:hypothetical protein